MAIAKFRFMNLEEIAPLYMGAYISGIYIAIIFVLIKNITIGIYNKMKKGGEII